MVSIKRTKEDIVVDSVNIFLLTIITIITLYPFYYILINSFNNGMDAARGGIFLWPRMPSIANYTAFFNNSKWVNALAVTVMRTVSGSVLAVFFTCLIAYGLAYKKLHFKRLYFALFIFPMYFSGGLITRYILYRQISMLDTFFVYIIPPALNIFFLLIAVSFFRTIPDELVESASLDGAGHLRIFLQIIIPVAMPLIACMFLYIGVDHWNAWLDSAYFVKKDMLRTISYRMMEVINSSTLQDNLISSTYQNMSGLTSRSLQMAAMMVATVPIMCVYPFLQKYFVKGLMLGAVKG
jgi:putative aldouronate transport system permease protein